jgi:membrane-associated protease RseP (regulator of RpoE activity)
MNLPDDAPPPRLCHLVKWPDFDGYGFNLHGEKTKPGQYIGKVDKDSPAELAGLRANDKIIEVNDTNIANENHKQVVQRIKAVPNETKLLVVDEKTDQYYKAKNIVVTGSMPNVIYKKTPVPRPTDTTVVLTPINNETVGNNGSTHSEEDRATHMSGSYHSGSGSSPPSKNNSLKKDERNGGAYSNDEEGSSMGPSPTPPTSSASPSPIPMLTKSGTNARNQSSNFLDLNISAKEMRDRLIARKKDKPDPKSQNIDWRKKYDIIQAL